MLRISETESGNGPVALKLEGRVIGPWVGELQRTSERILDACGSLRVDLADVSYVDREGVKLLLALQRKRVVLEGCSPFVMEELKEAARSETAGCPTSNGQAV